MVMSESGCVHSEVVGSRGESESRVGGISRKQRRSQGRGHWDKKTQSSHNSGCFQAAPVARQRSYQCREGGHVVRGGTATVETKLPVDRERKKAAPTSLTHLLNFTVTPRERQHAGSGLVTGGGGRRRRGGRTRVHSYNKEQFLQANCQFVVSSSGDYSVHSTDPDLLVDWDKIEQVRLFCHQIPSCPICLYPPRAAKITRCGHVFCWSCILHYLSLGERKWRKCPICYESIYGKDLKSVTALASSQYRVGDTITMTLMLREKGTVEVVPCSQWRGRGCGLPSIGSADTTGRFTKLLSASPAQVLEGITGPEGEQLRAQLSGLGTDESSELCFVESAREEHSLREALLRPEAAPLRQKQALATPTKDKREGGQSEWTAERTHQAAFSDREEEEEEMERDRVMERKGVMEEEEEEARESSGSSLSSPDGSPEASSRPEYGFPSPSSTSNGDYAFFYQASDGQHLYLHPVNARCLAMEYGALQHCPDQITATIVETEQLSVTEEVRDRYRYLSHLPLTCELVLCELELRPPLLSKDTLRAFAGELQRRRQKRSKKEREDKLRDRKAEREASPSMTMLSFPGLMPTRTMTPEQFHDILSLASSPPLTPSHPPPLTPSHPAPLPPSHPAPLTPSRPTLGKVEEGGEGEGESVVSSSAPSFAQALQGKPPPVWPAPHTPRSSPTSGLSSCKAQSAEVEGEEEKCFSAPTFKEAFNEALLSASVSVLAAQHGSGGKPGSKTARKGRKKMVLFTTGGARGMS